MARNTFPAEVLTPEGEVFNEEIEMLSTRTTVGSIGMLANHEPLLATPRADRAAAVPLGGGDRALRAGRGLRADRARTARSCSSRRRSRREDARPRRRSRRACPKPARRPRAAQDGTERQARALRDVTPLRGVPRGRRVVAPLGARAAARGARLSACPIPPPRQATPPRPTSSASGPAGSRRTSSTASLNVLTRARLQRLGLARARGARAHAAGSRGARP